MATGEMSEALRHLHASGLLGEGAGRTDEQLLEDYLGRREEAALAVLVRRHGPMVWGVCRRVLGHHQDAEDAFQATFLVLIRKAPSIRQRELLAGWLHGVAYQTARKARSLAARRKERERPVSEAPEPEAAPEAPWDDLRSLLDEEVGRLPARYRAPLVLCDLEGKARKEAAEQLGCPEGTVAGRLARARAMLAKRLARRGVGLTGEALAAMLARDLASAGLPASLVSAMLEAASVWVGGNIVAAAPVSSAVSLTERVLKTMLLRKLGMATALVLVACALGAGAFMGLVETRAADGQQANEEQRDERPPVKRKAAPKDDQPADIQGRLRDLDKRIQALTRDLEALRKDVKHLPARPAGRGEVQMFSLRNTKADEVAKTLEQLFNAPAAFATARPPQPLRIATHAGTNTLIIQGGRDDLDTVEAIITRLEDSRPVRKDEKKE